MCQPVPTQLLSYALHPAAMGCNARQVCLQGRRQAGHKITSSTHTINQTTTTEQVIFATQRDTLACHLKPALPSTSTWMISCRESLRGTL